MNNSIPPEMRAPAEAALEWINTGRERPFELTGLADVGDQTGDSFELGLVVCDGELCDRVQVSVMSDADGYRFARVEQAAPEIPPLLDPPPGLRLNWLDKVLAKHEFVVLLFYRGLW